jgi:hypothetical protein
LYADRVVISDILPKCHGAAATSSLSRQFGWPLLHAAALQRHVKSPYILRVMRKRKQYLWEVSRVGGTPATFIAVYAADEKQALKDGRAE